MANPSVEEKIKAAAAAKGIPVDLAMRMASAESRYSPNAQNPRSTAGGVFQIIDDTWKRYGGAPGKRFDVDENIRVGTNIIADNQVNMRRLLNRQPTYAEVYAAHYFGPDKAKAVINASPDTPSNTIFSAKVLKANPNLKDKTTAEIMAMLDKKMSPTGRSAPPAPRGPAASEFAAPGRADPLLLTQNTQRTQALPDVSRETMLAALGPNYQAAMALSYLSGNTDEDDSDLENAKDRIAADRESARSPGMEFLMEERRPSPFAGMDLTASTPFAEPVARMADGGVVHRADGSPPEGEAAQKDNTTSAKAAAMLRGFGDSAYSLAGGPVDLVTMAMRPFGYKAEKPILGSDWIKQKAEEYGIRPGDETDPQLNRLRKGSEFVSSFINPTTAVLTATTAGREAVAAGKAAVNAAVSATGEKMGKAVLNKMDKIIEAKRQRLIEKAATRALTPRETRSLRLIEADMADPTGMYRISRNPGLLERITDEQNIARVHGPAVPEVAPVAPPINVNAPEMLPPPPAEVNIPAEMLAPPGQVPANQNPPGWQVIEGGGSPALRPSVGQPTNAPFVGRLDTFVQSLKGPVTLGQLKGQLAGKFRDYDLARVDEAFKGMDPNTKLKPAQIVSALDNTFSPSKFLSETISPTKGALHPTADTVYTKPFGTTNLYLAQPEDKITAHNEVRKVIEGLAPFSSGGLYMPKLSDIEETIALLNSNFVKSSLDPALANELLTKLNKIKPRVQELSVKDALADNLRFGLAHPDSYRDPELVKSMIANLSPQEDMHLINSIQGKEAILTPGFFYQQQRYKEVLNEQGVGDFNQQWGESKRYAAKKVHELMANQMEKAGYPRPDFSGVNYNDLSNLHKQPEIINIRDNFVEPMLVQNRMDLNAIKKYTGETVKKVSTELEKSRLYEGKHQSVAGEPYPIGFTRFTEHEVKLGGQTLQGRHFHEVQSDLSKAVKQKGPIGKNKEVDQAEYDDLKTKYNQTSNALVEATIAAAEAKKAGVDTTKQDQLVKTLKSSLSSMDGRVSTLGNRLRTGNASYSLQEPFAGFETNSNVRSQLLMKNAIYSAMKDGKNFATFPGQESDQAQLYVGKVMPNLKQIAKDLGGEKAGISVTPIQLPPADKSNTKGTHDAGVPLTAWGITWSPEAAARITKTGMPFAKGGMVERRSDDNRRYL